MRSRGRGVFLFEGHDVGRALVRLRDDYGIDIELFLHWFPTLAEAVARADEELLEGVGAGELLDGVEPDGLFGDAAPDGSSGEIIPDESPGGAEPEDAWGDWALASNGMMLPEHLAGREPYPGWGDELFGDFDGDGLVTQDDFDRARTAAERNEPVQVVTWNGIRIIAPIDTGDPAGAKPAPTAPIVPDAGIIISSVVDFCWFRSIWEDDCYWLPWPRDPINEEADACCGYDGSGRDPPGGPWDIDGDGIPNGQDGDVDGDGTPNGNDNDVDGDGIPNGEDPDINNDGTPNGGDNDMDGDGIPNGQDNDTDGDGIPNGDDPSPNGCGIEQPCDGPVRCPGDQSNECDDGNPCTSDGCSDGYCNNESLTGTPCDSDTDPCMYDYCDAGVCIDTCSDCASCDFGLCFACACELVISEFDIETGRVVCRGSDVYVNVTGSCRPDCGELVLGVETPPPSGSGFLTMGDPIPCDGDIHTVSVRVKAYAAAPLGPMEFQLHGVRSNGDVIYRDGSVTVVEGLDLGISGIPNDNETDPGGFLVLNDDDDNNNGGPDMNDGGATGGEDDLLALTLSAEASSWDEVALDFVSGAGKVKVYERPDRTDEITTWPHTWATSSLSQPKTIFVEGVVVSESLADIELELRHVGVPGAARKDRVNLTVYHLTDVAWETAQNTGNLPLDNDTVNNGGKRILPGKLSPGDTNPAVRRTVDLVATVEPTVPELEGRPVYFKVWDVDDPFDQLYGCPGPTPDGRPCMPDVGVIDDNTTGPDNRGTESLTLPWTASGQVDATGKARVTFTVSMQPGNNYRAAASCLNGKSSAICNG